jgi:hypothetical protein
MSERKLNPGDLESIEELRARNLRFLERSEKHLTVSNMARVVTSEVVVSSAPAETTTELTNVVGNFGYVGRTTQQHG